MKNIDTSIKIMGIDLDSRQKSELLNEIGEWIDNSSKVAYIFTPNPEQVALAWRSPAFQAILHQGKWLVPDGIGLVWASQLKSLITGSSSLEKSLPGRELALDLITFAKNTHKKVLVIGGRGYSGRFPASWPVTWIEGYAEIESPTREEEVAIAKVVTKLHPEIVMVALGAPHQEQWLVEHRELLDKSGVKVGMTVGGTFDVLLGKVKAAPQIWSRLGLEWLYRLIQEPWRWRRQSQLPVFIWLVIKDVFRK